MEGSVIAKSTGEQEEEDMEPQDASTISISKNKKEIIKGGG